MMKKVALLLIAIVLVFGLVLTAISCSSGGGTTPSPTEPAVEATAIPHDLEGFEDCLGCHTELSESHADYTSEDCTTCHEPAS